MNIIKKLEENNIVFNRNAIEWHVNTGEAAVYDPVSAEMIGWANKNMNIPIPTSYQNFLASSNGFFYKSLTLYGIPPSRFKGVGLNRTQLEPMSIVEAQEWETNVDLKKDEISIGYIEGEENNIDVIMGNNGNIRQCSYECILFNDLEAFLLEFLSNA